MAKSANAKMADARRKREAAALKAAGGNRYLASYRHHAERLERATLERDYSTIRDAQKAMVDLRPYLPKESLYSWARDLARQYGVRKASQRLARDLEGQKTPDGASYTLTSLREALRGILD